MHSYEDMYIQIHCCQLFNLADFFLPSPKKPEDDFVLGNFFLLLHSASFQRRHYDVMPRFGNCIISQ